MPSPCVVLKPLTFIGYIGMGGGLLGLLVTRNLVSTSPLVLSLQVSASADALGAGHGRSTQFPCGDQPDGIRFIDGRAISAPPTSDFRSDVPVQLGWSCGALVLERGVVGRVDSGERGDANLMRGSVIGGPRS